MSNAAATDFVVHDFVHRRRAYSGLCGSSVRMFAISYVESVGAYRSIPAAGTRFLLYLIWLQAKSPHPACRSLEPQRSTGRVAMTRRMFQHRRASQSSRHCHSDPHPSVGTHRRTRLAAINHRHRRTGFYDKSSVSRISIDQNKNRLELLSLLARFPRRIASTRQYSL